MKTIVFIVTLILSAQIARAEKILPMMEPLMGVFTDVTGVHIQAKSGGCTTKESFAVQKDMTEPFLVIGFYRVDTDLCLARFQFGVILNYSYDELGIDPGDNFLIQNPLTFTCAGS